MKIARIVFSFIFLFALSAVVSWGLYKFIAFFFSLELDPNVKAGLIGATALIFASIVSTVIQKRSEQELNIQIEHRKNFGPIYEEFINNRWRRFYWISLVSVLFRTRL